MTPKKPGPTIGKKLKRARKAAGLSWYALAKRSLVSQQQVQRVESGESSPTVATLEKLADAMIEAKMLTRWQADKLLAGKHKGFHLGKYKLLEQIGKGGIVRDESIRRKAIDSTVGAIESLGLELVGLVGEPPQHADRDGRRESRVPQPPICGSQALWSKKSSQRLQRSNRLESVDRSCHHLPRRPSRQRRQGAPA